MGAFCHVTPVLNDILDLCRFDLTYLTPLPTKISQDAFRHITPQPFNQSASSRSRHNKNHVLPKRSTMLKSISCLLQEWFSQQIRTLAGSLSTGSKGLFMMPSLDGSVNVSEVYEQSIKCKYLVSHRISL